MIFLWTATQAQRDHKIIHARNFRVQPQANMALAELSKLCEALEEVDQQVVGL